MKKTILLFALLIIFTLAASAQRPFQQNVVITPGQWFTAEQNPTGNKDYSVQFSASSPVEVYLLDLNNYYAWQKGNSFSYIYFSGRIGSGGFNVRLSRGNYKLVVSNRFSVFTSKNVNLQFLRY